MNQINYAAHEAIASEIEQFLAKGGQIKQITTTHAVNENQGYRMKVRRLLKECIAAGHSSKEIAADAGVAFGNIGKITSCSDFPSIEMYKRIHKVVCEKMGVSEA